MGPWALPLPPGPVPGAWSSPLAKRSVFVTLQTAAPSRQRARDSRFMGWPWLGCSTGSKASGSQTRRNSWPSCLESHQLGQVCAETLGPHPRRPSDVGQGQSLPWLDCYIWVVIPEKASAARLPERRAALRGGDGEFLGTGRLLALPGRHPKTVESCASKLPEEPLMSQSGLRGFQLIWGEHR